MSLGAFLQWTRRIAAYGSVQELLCTDINTVDHLILQGRRLASALLGHKRPFLFMNPRLYCTIRYYLHLCQLLETALNTIRNGLGQEETSTTKRPPKAWSMVLVA
jgi:hypothetical protein